MGKLLIIFTGITILSVITYTTKSIVTIKGGKMAAALTNAVNSAVYMLLIIYTVSDLPMWLKIVVTIICNFVGVYIIKLVEAKMQKDKLWKIEITAKSNLKDDILDAICDTDLSYSYKPVYTDPFMFRDERISIELFCYTKEETQKAEQILKKFDVKYSIFESKSLV